MIEDFADVLGRPWARRVLVTVFLEGAFLYGPFAFIPAHLHLRFGVPLSLAGTLVMLLYGLGGLLFALGSSGSCRASAKSAWRAGAARCSPWRW